MSIPSDPVKLAWKSTPIRMFETSDGYWAKGILSVSTYKRGTPHYLPYGACARTPQLAVQKAESEMAERVVWFITLAEMQRQGKEPDRYQTSGWAAHTDSKAAQDKSVGEHLERFYLRDIMSELTDGSVRAPLRLLEKISSLDLESFTRWDSTIGNIEWVGALPVSFPQLETHVVYLLALVTLNEYSERGTVVGMGNASRIEDALYSATFELFLMIRALHHIRVSPGATQTGNLAGQELVDFDRFYRNPAVSERLERALHHNSQAPTSILASCNQQVITVPKYQTYDFSWLQPQWLLPLGRHIYYTGERLGEVTKRLEETYILDNRVTYQVDCS